MELTMNETTFSLRALKDSSNLVSSFWTILPNSNRPYSLRPIAIGIFRRICPR